MRSIDGEGYSAGASNFCTVLPLNSSRSLLLASNACGLVSRFWLHCWVPDASKHSTALSASR